MSTYDRGGMGSESEDQEAEDRKSGKYLGSKRKFEEFECPTCSAHNPHDTFGNGDEVNCNWCGLEFKALVDEEGKLKMKEA